jgi:hypothetical protein
MIGATFLAKRASEALAQHRNSPLHTPDDRANLHCCPFTTASRRNAARHRLLTAARLSVSTCAATVRASLLKARSHCPVAEMLSDRPIFCWEKIGTEPPAVFKFFEAETRISASYAKIGARYYYIRKAWGGGDHPLLGCQDGSALLVVCCLFDGSTARKMPYTPQD